MAGDKRERQKLNRQARIEAEQEARRKAARRRQTISLATIMVVVVGVLSFCQLTSSDDGEDVESVTTTTAAGDTTTTAGAPAAGSVAGKPCVARSEPLPEGAPEVPVKVGPPPTELISEDLVVGTGDEVKPGDSVTAHYIGISCSTGAIFDSSYSRGEPIPFSLSGVIKGWTDGIPGMKVGGRRLLGIPSVQAYAERGSGAKIAPDEALWFVVEIVATKPGA